MMIKKILLVKGSSAYNALRVFADELKSGFEVLGIQCDLLDMNLYASGGDTIEKELLYPIFMRYMETPPDFILSMSGVALSLFEIWLKKQNIIIPLCGYFVDHPMWNYNRFSVFSEKEYAFFVDDTFGEYTKKYHSSVHIMGTMYQAGIKSEKWDCDFLSRKNHIVFFGSYGNDDVLYAEVLEQAEKGEFSAVLIKEMVEYGIKYSEKTIEDIVEYVLAKHGLAIPAEKFSRFMSNITTVEFFLRQHFRKKCVRVLVDAGIEVEAYGDGWDDLHVERKDCLHVHPSVDYRKMADIMTEYRYSLNVLPWAKSGFHDRIATSMLNGCICITDTSTYIEKEHLSTDKLISYQLNKEDDLVHMVKKSMESEKQAEDMARKGQEYAFANHMWINRAEQFLNEIEKI